LQYFHLTTHTFSGLKNKLGDVMKLNQLVTTYERNLLRQKMYARIT
jgi:hypothetical protein